MLAKYCRSHNKEKEEGKTAKLNSTKRRITHKSSTILRSYSRNKSDCIVFLVILWWNEWAQNEWKVSLTTMSDCSVVFRSSQRSTRFKNPYIVHICLKPSFWILFSLPVLKHDRSFRNIYRIQAKWFEFSFFLVSFPLDDVFRFRCFNLKELAEERKTKGKSGRLFIFQSIQRLIHLAHSSEKLKS